MAAPAGAPAPQVPWAQPGQTLADIQAELGQDFNRRFGNPPVVTPAESPPPSVVPSAPQTRAQASDPTGPGAPSTWFTGLSMEQIQRLVLEHASAGQIRRVAAEQGMSSLREDGWRLIREGRTTLEEVLRVTSV